MATAFAIYAAAVLIVLCFLRAAKDEDFDG